MDFRTFTARQALAAFGACLGLLLLASPASAVPDTSQPQPRSEESDAFSRYLANHEAHEAGLGSELRRATRIVIPYLSHGEGVLVGEDGRPESQPAVIPYASHGLGVEDAGPAAHLREQPDGFQPQLHGVESTRVAANGFDWETTGYVTGAILGPLLLALMFTIALRDRRGLRSA